MLTFIQVDIAENNVRQNPFRVQQMSLLVYLLKLVLHNQFTLLLVGFKKEVYWATVDHEEGVISSEKSSTALFKG